MLQLHGISKTYRTGDLTQKALDNVSLNLRDNEFVAVLGPSGSGKTTLLNIIGGLDRYETGDLVINGVSTKKYKDRDWDSYRNHTIGFVFQSYNLISHQSALSNVELALTISGVSKSQRRRRAREALERVGLGDQLHKRPNQMSGGQMQRVAIARALVNDPDVLLADEPTGALDTETSVQVMELLKEVAKDRLVVMVTHNPELAERYATRIVSLRDGKITGDSDPCEVEEEKQAKPVHRNLGKASMSFFTALALSFNNLRTKKARTLLTSFAGSIGIIGIALILALSTGMNAYINNIQKETMASYPLTINSETFDASALTGLRGQLMEGRKKPAEDRNGVYADYTAIKASEAVIAGVQQNNLTEFKKYLDDPDSEIRQYLGENGVVYSYDVAFSVYSYDEEERLIDSDSDPEENSGSGWSSMMGMFSSMMPGNGSGAENFSELMAGANGETLSQVVTDSYELLYGAWPEAYDEVLLVLDRRNALSVENLYQLGLITKENYDEIVETIKEGKEAGELVLDYAAVCEHPFYLVAACDFYAENEDGTFSRRDDALLDRDALLENAVELKITGVVRPTEGNNAMGTTTAVAYTGKLTDYIITHTAESPVVKAQQKDPEINVLNGMKFAPASDEEKASMAAEYVGGLGVSEKASLYRMILYYSASEKAGDAPAEETLPGTASQPVEDPEGGEQPGMGQFEGQLGQGQEGFGQPGEGQLGAGQFGGGQMSAAVMDETALAAMLDHWLENDPDPEVLLGLYDRYIGNASYEDNMEAFGSVSYDTPSSISIYVDDFESKEAIADCITRYNDGVDEDNRISYVDYVAMMTSSLTTIINGISYVLIAFVSVSLVVSSIMIGVITYISVLERTKEIGILRALGASKGNISQVFNAETFIIGCCSGLIGIGMSLLLLLPINSIIGRLSGIAGLAAQLPILSAAVLVLISIVITIIGGLLPAKKAAHKDPVAALRTE